MHRNKTLRYTMFASLYFTQGTILSYFTALNALYLLSRGLTMTDVGVFAAIALLPFVLKIFLGMLSDRFNLLGLGHRKPYILIGLLVQTICLIIVPYIDPAQYFWGFVAVAFILQMGMALYDTCTDGLALDTTPTEEQGTIQGFMVGGRAVAVVVTASVVGLLAEYVSWTAVFWLLALITLVPIPLVLTAKEAKRTADEKFDWSAFAAFKQKTIIFLAILGFLFFFIIAGANQLVNPFLQESFGISLSMAGYYTTVWGIGVVLGATFGGRIYKKIGMRNAALGAMITGFVGVLALAFVGSPAMAWPLVALFGLAYGTQQTVYFALAMKYTVPRIAASMFAILMAITNIGQGAGMALSGMLVDATSFRITLVILAALNFLALPLLPKIFGRDGK
jgi:PAT family beta-lactamase induction signal transducer AmpG